MMLLDICLKLISGHTVWKIGYEKLISHLFNIALRELSKGDHIAVYVSLSDSIQISRVHSLILGGQQTHHSDLSGKESLLS